MSISLTPDAGPPVGPCGSYPYSPSLAMAKCQPPPPECGDGTPECMQLCDDLCTVAPACGHLEAKCLADCRDRLRCPGETPGMDLLICESLREKLVDDPVAQCSEIELHAGQPAAAEPLCNLLAGGASFEGETTSLWCPLDSTAPCVHRLTFGDGHVASIQGVAAETGSFTCSGDRVQLGASLGNEAWHCEVETFTLQQDGSERRLQLVEPAFPTTPPEAPKP